MANQIDWIKPHKGKGSGKPVKSGYGNGSYVNQFPIVKTIGELRELLKDLPGDLPIHGPFGGGAKPVWYNVGGSGEHVEITDVEDDDEDDDDDLDDLLDDAGDDE